MNPLEQDCTFCNTLIYWNREDKSMRNTGSWYESYLDILHDADRCREVRNR